MEVISKLFDLIKNFIDSYITALKKLVESMQNVKKPDDDVAVTGE